ncbi:hypothetical protein ebA5762 [Aromatoleum aromaticum EbN1]|uniref:Uncharacterized protein n=1 Tax=Aromatoleum aromaticum (strain DSM 19018 / LMG 30748 / EbN1) TaxID=76114 RepID=Q5NZW9_AROAE|nr:hypothetical protein ebA5762 [Aromatoleum aromaticum EbN1]
MHLFLVACQGIERPTGSPRFSSPQKDLGDSITPFYSSTTWERTWPTFAASDGQGWEAARGASTVNSAPVFN